MKEALVMVVLEIAAGGLEETDAMEIPMGPTSPIPPGARRSEFRMASVTCRKQHTSGCELTSLVPFKSFKPACPAL